MIDLALEHPTSEQRRAAVAAYARSARRPLKQANQLAAARWRYLEGERKGAAA